MCCGPALAVASRLPDRPPFEPIRAACSRSVLARLGPVPARTNLRQALHHLRRARPAGERSPAGHDEGCAVAHGGTGKASTRSALRLWQHVRSLGKRTMPRLLAEAARRGSLVTCCRTATTTGPSTRATAPRTGGPTGSQGLKKCGGLCAFLQPGGVCGPVSGCPPRAACFSPVAHGRCCWRRSGSSTHSDMARRLEIHSLLRCGEPETGWSTF